MPSKKSRNKKSSISNSDVIGRNVKVHQAEHLSKRNSQDRSESVSPADSREDNLSQASIPVPPPNWPSEIQYLTHPVTSPYLSISHKKFLRSKYQSPSQPHTHPQPLNEPDPTIILPISPTETSDRVEIRLITDQRHPAFGQRGLFAARDLQPGELVVAYLGIVHSRTEWERKEWEEHRRESQQSNGSGKQSGRGVDEMAGYKTNLDPHHDPVSETPPGSGSHSESPTSTGSNSTSEPFSSSAPYSPPPSLLGSWDTSTYDLNIHRSDTIELAIDASKMGNEARFVNDYRGVPSQNHIGHSESEGAGGRTEQQRQRREKRRVKGWNDTISHSQDQKQSEQGDQRSGRGDPNRDGDSDGDELKWDSGRKGQYDHFSDSAIPNAEFRDIWFEMPNHSDLNPDLKLDDLRLEMEPGPNTGQDEKSDAVDGHGEAKTTVCSPALRPRSGPQDPKQQQQPETPTTIAPRKNKKTGLRGVAIYVLPAGKSGKRKGGIKQGQEVLVSYGKGFWAHHSV